ncbi:MAG: 50S ribosomal protein L21 [Patescibacteria group bacterium]
MNKFAVIETGGKQYIVSAGDKLKVEKLSVKGLKAEEGSSFDFEKVLLVSDGDKVEVGMPYVSGAKVATKIVKQAKGEKKIVFRYHSKTRYRKRKGHRQLYTEVEITKV